MICYQLTAGNCPGMVPEGLCNQLQPPRPARLAILPSLGLEPSYRLPVQGDGHPLDEAGLQGLILSHRLFVGLWEELLGGLGTLEPGIVQLEVVWVAGYLFVDGLALLRGGHDDPVTGIGDHYVNFCLRISGDLPVVCLSHADDSGISTTRYPYDDVHSFSNQSKGDPSLLALDAKVPWGECRVPVEVLNQVEAEAAGPAEGVDHPQYLLRLAELELIDRHQRMVERRIRAARFPAVKSLDTFDFPAIPSLNKALVLELARCEYIQRRENVIAVGNSGTGKTHVALGLGLATCQRGISVGFTSAAALVHELLEARDERRLLNLQRQLSRLNLLIIDELGFLPLSRTGAELLFARLYAKSRKSNG